VKAGDLLTDSGRRASVTWYRMTPNRPPKRWSARLGDYGIDSKGGVWIPAELLGNPTAVLLCAGSDGVSICQGPGKRLFVPIDWAIEGYERTRNEDFARVKARMLEEHRLEEVRS
jgi:hypothetical protein